MNLLKKVKNSKTINLIVGVFLGGVFGISINAIAALVIL